jgi:prepilin-type N-terminal cleavage/methylation domain-containing protein
MKNGPRSGFTLIELMVSMALTLVVMTILAQAFAMALSTFSGLKGLGDMQQNLRTAAVVLRNDLSCNHFEGDRLVSDGNITAPASPPQAGFFSVYQGAASVLEGNDSHGVPSYRANNHLLYFTARRIGNQQESFFTTVLPASANLATFFAAQNKTAYTLNPTQYAESTLALPYPASNNYSSQWAEVIYYLVQNTNIPGAEQTALTNTPGVGTPTPLYSLYRAQFILPPDSTILNGTAKIANAEFSAYQGISCQPGNSGTLVFNSPSDVAQGKRAISKPGSFNPSSLGANVAATLVLPNVISFQVQVLGTSTAPAAVANNFGDPGVYDTTQFAGGNGNAPFYGLRAIQVTMRVWDAATRQTRQSSVVQAL